MTLEKSIPGVEAKLERGLTVVPDPIDIEKAPLSSIHLFARSATRQAMYSPTCVCNVRVERPEGVCECVHVGL